jgi:hypothetical protein
MAVENDGRREVLPGREESTTLIDWQEKRTEQAVPFGIFPTKVHTQRFPVLLLKRCKSDRMTPNRSCAVGRRQGKKQENELGHSADTPVPTRPRASLPDGWVEEALKTSCLTLYLQIWQIREYSLIR